MCMHVVLCANSRACLLAVSYVQGPRGGRSKGVCEHAQLHQAALHETNVLLEAHLWRMSINKRMLRKDSIADPEGGCGKGICKHAL